MFIISPIYIQSLYSSVWRLRYQQVPTQLLLKLLKLTRICISGSEKHQTFFWLTTLWADLIFSQAKTYQQKKESEDQNENVTSVMNDLLQIGSCSTVYLGHEISMKVWQNTASGNIFGWGLFSPSHTLTICSYNISSHLCTAELWLRWCKVGYMLWQLPVIREY